MFGTVRVWLHEFMALSVLMKHNFGDSALSSQSALDSALYRGRERVSMLHFKLKDDFPLTIPILHTLTIQITNPNKKTLLHSYFDTIMSQWARNVIKTDVLKMSLRRQ